MARGTTVCWMITMLLLASCGREQAAESAPAAEVLTASTLGDQDFSGVTDFISEPRYAGADRRNGEKRAQVCRACHSLTSDGPNMVGPNLYGIFGKRAGAVAGFDYSAALQSADFVWSPRALDAWLAQPARFLPGNRMSFPGVMEEGDRNDLIAFLLEVTDDGGEK